MRLIILGSGSSGNAVYVESGETRILIDAGLSSKETARRMTQLALNPTQLDAIILTHEHTDHVKGAFGLSRTAGVPVFVSEATRAHLQFPKGDRGMRWGEPITSSSTFGIGSLECHPFTVPHDGADTFALTVQSCGVKVAVVTDLGYITQLVAERLRGSHLVIMESNHDREMLKVGPYPWSVKQRIASNVGHVSNEEIARWIREDFDGQAEYLVLAHLSRHCNHPEIARLSALRALETHGTLFFSNAEQRVKVAHPDQSGEWFEF